MQNDSPPQMKQKSARQGALQAINTNLIGASGGKQGQTTRCRRLRVKKSAQSRADFPPSVKRTPQLSAIDN